MIQDLDQNVKAILDWRVGVEISKDKQKMVLARCDGWGRECVCGWDQGG